MTRQRLTADVESLARPGPARRSGGQSAGPGATRADHALILQLQRTHGNRYVQQLLSAAAAERASTRVAGGAGGTDGVIDPASDADREVSGHELVHAVQRADGASPLVQRARKRKRPTKKTTAPASKRKKTAEEPAAQQTDDESPQRQGRKRKTPSTPASSTPAKRRKTDADIPVDYLDLKAMKSYLGPANPVREVEVGHEPLSVGVVVWNINHLKADADDDEPGADLEDEDVESVDLEDQDVESVKNTDAIRTNLTDLAKKLGQVARLLNTAADGVIRELDKAEKTKANSSTRREVSQFKQDVKELAKIPSEEVLSRGIAAMSAGARRRGSSTVETRAEQLEQLRELNRVWKRLKRIQGFLITGKPRLPQKQKALDAIRKKLTKWRKEAIGQEIEQLLDAIKIKNLQAALNALKRGLVLDLTTKKFFENPSVNLVLINEMNLGIKHLSKEIDESEDQIGLSMGPRMLAKGKTRGSDADPEDDSEADPEVVGKQHEYYPAVHRTGSEGLESPETFYVNTSGKFIGQGGDKNSAIPWDKGSGTFRGIVVHRYIQKGQKDREFWAGVLHTTPAGKDLDRTKIWPQIEKPLGALNELALHFGIPLLVAGDFYIPAEGIVNAPTTAQMGEIRAADHDQIGRPKAIQFARNIFLAALTADRLDELPPKAKRKTTRKVGTGRKKANARPKKKPEFTPSRDLVKPEHGDPWNRYKNAVASELNEVAGMKRFNTAKALKLLAPGMVFDVGISWNQTLAAGSIGEHDIVRNSQKQRFTMQRAIEPLGYRIVEAGNPTNPKATGRGENTMQLADLFLVNKFWKTTRSGIMTPGTGKLKPVDDAKLSATKTYWKISDHSPALMLASTEESAPDLYDAFDMAPNAADTALSANLAQWDTMAKRLEGLQTQKGAEPIADQIAKIKQFLQKHPLVGPDEAVLKPLRKLVSDLRSSIKVNGRELPAEKQEALADLAQWQHPYYSVDVGEKSPAEPS